VNDRGLYKLAESVGNILLARGYFMTTAESCTGGWVAKVITDIAGSSNWFERGFITYSNRAKREQLGLDDALISVHGAVSQPVVEAMAAGALQYSAAQVAVAVSGVAGPGSSAGKPAGMVWFSWAIHTDATRILQLQSSLSHFEGDREAVRRAAVARALAGIVDLFEDMA
jgi:nicotinamide-nucleotide amidase